MSLLAERVGRDRDESISPSTLTPRSLSPKSTRNPNGNSSQRDLQKIDRSRETNGVANGAPSRPTTSGSITFDIPKPPPKEFPFNAPAGQSGLQPTTRSLLDGNGHVPNGAPVEAAEASEDAGDEVPPMQAPLSRVGTYEGESAAATPSRRSVQFARDTQGGAHSRHQSLDDDGGETTRDRQASSLFSKLRALASPAPGHGRTPSNLTVGDANYEGSSPPGRSPGSERGESRFFDIREDAYEADADAEESGNEGDAPRRKQRRKSRRMADSGADTAPTTPKAYTSRLSSFITPTRSSHAATASEHRPAFASRRATMTDIPEHQRMGFSEDEGRDRLARQSAWKRGLQNARGLSYSVARRHDSDGTPDTRRPNNLRRFTNVAGMDGTPLTGRKPGDRTQSMSLQKWRNLKAGLKLMGQRKREVNRIDHAKSAQLLAELMAGAPAALFLASMFQRDDHGRKRIPVLLEQLKVKVIDSERQTNKPDKVVKEEDRHPLFKIELEYGSGITRMKWVIKRHLRDFVNLQLKFKSQQKIEKYIQRRSDDSSKAKMPQFPRSVFPYARTIRGLFDDDEDEEEVAGGAASGQEGEADRPGNWRRRSSFNFVRRKSSIGSPTAEHQLDGSHGSGLSNAPGKPRETYAERQRRRLEEYLQAMITWCIFRPDSNRLCKFLELSALGVRLAPEGGYKGKEGIMTIRSAKGMDFRRAWRPGFFKERHEPMWFLVRQSYVVCVDSPEDMNIYDVFLVDSDFSLEQKRRKRDESAQALAKRATASATQVKGHHQLKMINSERKVKLLAKTEKQLQQWKESIQFMVDNTEWSQVHRFDSFAPVRKNVYAHWLVDGRDYMWAVSKAIDMAKDVVYIHDWWLSPELYMRRPPAISQKWRLDRLLLRKAREGVKVFVIVYRNINSAIPIDSEYTKFSLLDLHTNISVQRSPNQFRQNTFFWAHHEKICIVDHLIAFCGGVDLCFGRWDTPEHTVVDDKLTGFELNDEPKDSDHCQMWPGKDYSNPRVQDFYALDKPYEEMYDRTKVPRMPWHDIGMQMVGQPARDLARHFVQRWNYILRQRKPSRPTPFLLPPPDVLPEELEALDLRGTCDIQICRSASPWSIGTPEKTECSIQNAYVKLIETSEHFVYIENQFFISSCEVEGVRIENSIGDALVERIVRADEDDEDWRAVIIIPLMPGFQNTVDQADGSSVRLIMQCQYRSICRGESSIFQRLRNVGIDPEEYIQFYALRSWGNIGPHNALVTEQLYIHAKCMIVDDRFCIIGSANINERSMLGSRDSEVAAVIQDHDMIDSVMAGQPYKVGRFPHTLRVRLMREHLGLNVDEIAAEEEEMEWEQMTQSQYDGASDVTSDASVSTNHSAAKKIVEARLRAQDDLIAKADLHTFNHDCDWEQATSPSMKEDKILTKDPRIMGNTEHHRDVIGDGPDHLLQAEARRLMSKAVDGFVSAGKESKIRDSLSSQPNLLTPEYPKGSEEKTRTRGRALTAPSRSRSPRGSSEEFVPLPPPRAPSLDSDARKALNASTSKQLPDLDDTDIGGPPLMRNYTYRRHLDPAIATMEHPKVTKDCMTDPVSEAFIQHTWHTIAENNTKLFRHVFRCMPDNEVRTWTQYNQYENFSKKFNTLQGQGPSSQRPAPGATGPPGHGSTSGNSISEGASIAESKVENLGEKTIDKVSTKQSNGSKRSIFSRMRGNSKASSLPPPSRQDGAPTSLDSEKIAHRDMQETPSTTVATPEPPSTADASATNEKAALAAGDPPADEDDTLAQLPTRPASSDILSLPATLDATSEKPPGRAPKRARTITISEESKKDNASTVTGSQKSKTNGATRKRRATTKSSMRAFQWDDEDAMLSKEDAESLLKRVQGHLVVWPYDWLDKEEGGSRWLYTVDQLAPLEIYN